MLEPKERGVYSGALGWIDASGAMDASVVIRAGVVAGGRISVGVGGAIVADSDPASERAEAMLTARALALAILRVRAGAQKGVLRAPAEPASGAAAPEEATVRA